MVKKLVVKKIISDEEVSNLEGKWIEESHIQHLVKSDTDVYRLDDNGNEIL